MLDLQEYSYFTAAQKNTYKKIITSKAKEFSAAAAANDFPAYMGIMEKAMQEVFKPTEPMMCSNLIVMGDCTLASVCPPPLTMKTVGTNKYCVCPSGQTMMLKPGQIPPFACQAGPCPIGMKIITETATGQQACATSCPPRKMGGYTCL
jgi:hypothetical protein